MRAQVDLIPEHVASRIVSIQEQLVSHVIQVPDRARLAEEQSRLWAEHFPGKAYEEIAALVPTFIASQAA
jgi:hypothetical protein